jgi:hypothetical protein
MRAKKVTILLFLTVISLLTIFFVLLLDDKVLAAVHPDHRKCENLGLPGTTREGMMMGNHSPSGALFCLRDKLKIMEAV